jgi:predicted flap endonuclease-1-like 5' DNA nuclease/predicted  nucleic acid-binding Zn-ribbon protein
MPEITVIHIALLAVMLVAGIVVGWIARASRCAKEKSAVNVGWHEQLSAQRSEHDRLGGQNKSLMEQISQYQASNTDAKLRAKELSDALKEAFERRDELQRQIKDIRGDLESAVAQRDKLRTDMRTHTDGGDRIKEKDEQIVKLSRELEGWQDRLPPLIERFQVRNEEAIQLEADLAEARERINALETMIGSDQTRVEPVDPDSLTDGMDASNDSLDEPSDADSGSQHDSVDPELADDVFAEVVEESDESIVDSEEMDSIMETFQETATNQLLGDLDDLKNELSEDEAADEVVGSPEPEATAGSNGDLRDDLKQIKGIGPAIEKTLNEMGISRFNQISEMSEYDIDRIAKRLKGFRSRIYREDWIGQARDQQSQIADERS